MFPKPRQDLVPNTAAFERLPLVKATGFREYDARWLYPALVALADDGADVEAVLQLPQYVGLHVDDGDLVGLFAREVVRSGGADLTCPEDENFHCS